MAKNNILYGGFSTIFKGNVEKGTGKAVKDAALYILFGFLCSRAQIFGNCAPFGIAAVAAAGPGDGIFVLFGAMAGYLLPQGPLYAIRYVAAAVAVFLFKWVLSGFEELAAHPAFAPCVAGLAAAVTGAAVVFSGSASPYDILTFLTETLLCAFSASFFGQARAVIRAPSGFWGLSQRELISVIICIGIILLPLERLQFSGISLGRIAAVFVIMCAARYGRESGGAVMGVTAGMMLSLAGGASSGMLAGFGFGGLVAGIFSPCGKLWCSAGFLLADAVAGITAGGDFSKSLIGAYEATVAAVIFMLVPEKLLCRTSGLFSPSQNAGERRAREDICKRLSGTADALDEISEMISQVRKKLDRHFPVDMSKVYAEVAATNCKQCGMSNYCWGTVYSDTMNTLEDVSDTLKKSKMLTRGDVPAHFAARCCKLGDFVGSLNRCYAEFAARSASELKADSLRALMAPAVFSASFLLRDISSEFSSGKRQASGGGRVRAAFAACGLCVSCAKLFIDSRGRLTVEAYTEEKSAGVTREKLLGCLDSACGRTMDGPRVFENEETGELRLVFTQKPAYRVRFGEAAIQKTGESLCGDACDSFVDENGRAVMILSDGMGCGGGAAVDSNLTVGLAAKLLRCGFSFEEAANIAGTAMILKSGEESFSTLDIVCIDLYDGSAVFLKAGAPPTYVRRRGKVERIEPSSMPIGILPETRLEKAALRLNSGDLVVAVSDGALCCDDNYIINEMEAFSGEPRALAKRLAESAKKLRSDGHDDDITVMAAAIV